MKHLKSLPFLFSIIIATGCSNIEHIQTHPPEARLYGEWNCKLSIEEEKVKVYIDYDVSYVRNGKSNGFGTLKVKLPELPEMEYSVTNSSNWEYKNGYLIETTTEIKLVNISHPEFDDVFNLERMFPQNISESSKVLILSHSQLKIKSETNGTVYSCNKIQSNS